jgi:hypothetical protein
MAQLTVKVFARDALTATLSDLFQLDALKIVAVLLAEMELPAPVLRPRRL